MLWWGYHSQAKITGKTKGRQKENETSGQSGSPARSFFSRFEDRWKITPLTKTIQCIKKKNKSIFREYAEAIFIALLLALFIRTFIIQAFKIPSGSMQNTLLIGDHILVSKFAYGVHIPNVIPFLNIKLFDDIVLFQKTPKREDIIVFKYPKNENRDFIKRVIGIPGDLC